MSSSTPTPTPADKPKRSRKTAEKPAPVQDAKPAPADAKPGDRRTEDGREEVFCRGWNAGGISPHWQDAEKFFADRKNGGRHWTARCVDCERAYRKGAKERAESGERTPQARGSRKPRRAFRTTTEAIEFNRLSAEAAKAAEVRDQYFEANTVTVEPDPPKPRETAAELKAKVAALEAKLAATKTVAIAS